MVLKDKSSFVAKTSKLPVFNISSSEKRKLKQMECDWESLIRIAPALLAPTDVCQLIWPLLVVHRPLSINFKQIGLRSRPDFRPAAGCCCFVTSNLFPSELCKLPNTDFN